MRSLFLATEITASIAYLVWVLLLIVAPQATMAFFSYVLHANLSGIIRSVTWGSFIVGLLVWSVGTGLYAAFGEIENNSVLAVFLGLGTVIIFDQVFPSKPKRLFQQVGKYERSNCDWLFRSI